MKQYVAFLLGINVGGRTVKMDRLKAVMEKAGYSSVKTLLASGNVMFESKESPETLTGDLERLLSSEFGYEIKVIVRSVDELKILAAKDPFKEINVTSMTRRYVTFLGARPKGAHITSSNPNLKILSCSDHEIITILTLTEGSKTVDLMKELVKCYGKYITTRNWNTLERLLAM